MDGCSSGPVGGRLCGVRRRQFLDAKPDDPSVKPDLYRNCDRYWKWHHQFGNDHSDRNEVARLFT
jgi:hypothetical protein